jgi:Holliday junction resolvase-like predicted endonuclease
VPCEKCGSVLLLGIKGKMDSFCPICEGLTTINKPNSQRFLGEEISKRKTEIENIFKKYNKESIVGSLVASRELQPYSAKSGSFNPSHFLGTNQSIVYALKFDNFGKSKLNDVYGEDFQKILHYGIEIVTNINMIRLISEEYCVQLEIPKEKDPKKYVADNTITPILYGKTSENFGSILGRKPFKFTKKWERILENYKKFGLVTETELYKYEIKKRKSERMEGLLSRRTKKIYRKKVKKTEKTEKIYLQKALSLLNSLELGDLSRNQLKFHELKDDLEYNVGLLKLFSRWALDCFECDDFHQFSGEKTLASLSPISYEELYEFYRFIYPDSFSKFYDIFVSREGDVKKFPLIIKLKEDEYLIPPNSIYLISQFLTWKYILKNELNDLKSLEGYGFENVVAKKLKDIGVCVDYINLKDDVKNPTLEIDVIAHYKKTIFVIECKSWLLRSGYLFDKAQRQREKDLTEQAQKQAKRVDYVKNNLKLLCLDKINIKEFKSIILTKLNESMEKVDSSYVIPFDQIDELLKI